MKDVCITKYINTLIKFSVNINEVFAKVIILNTLLVMIEKWKEALNRGGLGGAFKAFDCIKHDLMIAKLAAHGFDSY